MEKKATKSFKIGECAIGGIIQATTEPKTKTVIVAALDYNSKEVVMVKTFSTNDLTSRNSIDNFLNELTSSYYADKVMKFIQANTGVI